MSRKEAIQALIDAVNTIVKKRNALVLEQWEENVGWAVVNGKQKFIPQPPITNVYSKRHIQRVVHIARQQGNMGDLIEAAGYRRVK